MFGPEHGLVFSRSLPVQAPHASAGHTNNNAASPVTITRVPLLPAKPPMNGVVSLVAMCSDGKLTTSATVARIKKSRFEVTTPTGACFSAMTVPSNIKKKKEDDTPLYALVCPAPPPSGIQSSSGHAATTANPAASLLALHTIMRLQPAAAKPPVDAPVESSLARFHQGFDYMTSLGGAVEKTLQDDVWDDEDPSQRFRKKSKHEDGAVGVDDDDNTRESTGTAVKGNEPVSKKPRIDSASGAGAASAMPPPLPVSRLPSDLDDKIREVLTRHRGGGEVDFELFWKDAARLMDEFQTLKKKTKDEQMEWVRVFRSAVIKRLDILGVTVKNENGKKTVVVP